MDEDFKYFYETKQFGPAIQSAPVPEASFRKYGGKLPNQLLDYWKTYGWCGFGEGLFWMVNPEAYAPVVDIWLAGTGFNDDEGHHVIARSAFGDLYLWGEKSGQSITIDSHWAMLFPRDQREKIKAGKAEVLAKRFFSSTKKPDLDMNDTHEKPMFERARKALEPLDKAEMYGFVPALRLGGACEVANLRKVRAVEHLVMLGQLGPVRVMADIVAEAKKAGL